MKLCVFQGTFDPIHNAHIRIAKFAQDYFKFDKFLFIPAKDPPHKNLDSEMSIHRFNMVKLALSESDEFEVSDIEFKKEGKSYTYLTILDLYKNYKIDGKINFLIGTDAFCKIQSWYESDKLKELVKFLVFDRGYKFDNLEIQKLVDCGYDFEFVNLEFFDVSSSDIREKLKSNIDVSDLINDKVGEYIKTYGLYKN